MFFKALCTINWMASVSKKRNTKNTSTTFLKPSTPWAGSRLPYVTIWQTLKNEVNFFYRLVFLVLEVTPRLFNALELLEAQPSPSTFCRFFGEWINGYAAPASVAWNNSDGANYLEFKYHDNQAGGMSKGRGWNGSHAAFLSMSTRRLRVFSPPPTSSFIGFFKWWHLFPVQIDKASW